MQREAEILFHELADLTPIQRERYFSEHRVSAEVRSEVEALLQFDSPKDHVLTESVLCAAEQSLDALISGNFADVGRFKGPILRGLAARAPYFHSGSAQSLMDVVDFYDSRFNIGFTMQEKLDLVAFLNSL